MEELNERRGPMPAFKCTIRCTAKHGLTRILPIVIQLYKDFVDVPKYAIFNCGGARNA